ncbi:MAG: matrixin family metalloprotease, partial [Planctomycetaceae bacterium]|nr:matrixin family metalloprotease [Planctomycetaceae bacterium]
KLDLGETWLFSATGAAIVGAYANTATVSGTDATGTIAAPQSANATDGYFGVAPGVAIEKLTNGMHDPSVAAGSEVTWSYVVTNTGNVPLNGITLSDDQGVVPQDQSGDINADGKLDLGETWVFAATGVAVVGSYVNTATVIATDATGTIAAPQSANASDGYFGVAPGVAIVKLTNGTHNPNVPAGSEVTWSYVVTNTGNVPLNGITLSDDQGVVPQYQSGDANADGKLDLGETWLFSATGTAIVGAYANTVTVTGTDVTRTVATAQVATATDGYFGVQPGIQVVKKTNGSDNAGANVAAGSAVTWTYIVTNAGNVALNGVTVTDSDPTVQPTYVSGDANSNSKLDVGEAWTYTATGVAMVGAYSNTATVLAADATGTVATPVSASESDGYFGVQPGIKIVKTTNGTDNNSAPGVQVTAGSAITWTYTVANTGNVALSGVTVTDSDSTLHPTYVSGDVNANQQLDVGETWVYTASGVAITGAYSNTGTVRGTDATGTIAVAVSASDVDCYTGVAPATVKHGDFATIGFWHNKNGQALIKSLNGSANSTALAQWLATSFPKLYGATAGVYSMVNSNGSYFTNTQVATAYNTYFFTTGSGAKTNGQILAAALGVYATSTTLAGGNYARKYGFNVSAAGAGWDTVTLGSDAPAFGNAAQLTVLQMLQSVNAQASAGVLYAASSQKSTFCTEANHAFDTKINSAGDIAMMVLGSQADATFDATLTSDALHLSTLLVYVDNTAGNMTIEEAARISDAVENLNAQLGAMGMCLITVPDEIGLMADITISMADTTAIGGAAEGVLGLTEMGGTITLVSGWDWYTGNGATAIAAGQYDFETVATHELGHGIGLGHSADRASVMFPYLSTGEVRHELTANDIAIIGQYAPGELAAMAAAMLTGSEALMAEPMMAIQDQPAPAISAAGCDQVFGRIGESATIESMGAARTDAKALPATHDSAVRSVMADWLPSGRQDSDLADWLTQNANKRGKQEARSDADSDIELALTDLRSGLALRW